MEFLEKFYENKSLDGFLENVFKGFQIDLDSWLEIEYHLIKDARLDWKALDDWPFWRIWYYYQNYRNEIEEKNKQNKAENQRYEKEKSKYNTSSMMRDATRGMPTIPSNLGKL